MEFKKVVCDFCGSENVVLTSGYHYCAACCRRNLDRVSIHVAIHDAFPLLTLKEIQDFCSEMFGTKDYGYAVFSNVYKYKERGQWHESQKRFEIPSNVYIVLAFNEFLKTKPSVYKRVENDRHFPVIGSMG